MSASQQRESGNGGVGHSMGGCRVVVWKCGRVDGTWFVYDRWHRNKTHSHGSAGEQTIVHICTREQEHTCNTTLSRTHTYTHDDKTDGCGHVTEVGRSNDVAVVVVVGLLAGEPRI